MTEAAKRAELRPRPLRRRPRSERRVRDRRRPVCIADRAHFADPAPTGPAAFGFTSRYSLGLNKKGSSTAIRQRKRDSRSALVTDLPVDPVRIAGRRQAEGDHQGEGMINRKGTRGPRSPRSTGSNASESARTGPGAGIRPRAGRSTTPWAVQAMRRTPSRGSLSARSPLQGPETLFCSIGGVRMRPKGPVGSGRAPVPATPSISALFGEGREIGPGLIASIAKCLSIKSPSRAYPPSSVDARREPCSSTPVASRGRAEGSTGAYSPRARLAFRAVATGPEPAHALRPGRER